MWDPCSRGPDPRLWKSIRVRHLNTLEHLGPDIEHGMVPWEFLGAGGGGKVPVAGGWRDGLVVRAGGTGRTQDSWILFPAPGGKQRGAGTRSQNFCVLFPPLPLP